jgi:hypothetical protein
LIKKEFLGINSTGESSLAIENKVWTSWQVIEMLFFLMENDIVGRTKMIEDGIMDKM